MSLDVYLYTTRAVPAGASERIFIRRDGATEEISRAEWEELYPEREPVTVLSDIGNEVYTANITHNLTRMADEAGLYEALWRPEDIDATRAEHLIERLREGLHRLRANRSHYEQWHPKNGWGDYDLLVRFTEGYLVACEEYPDAEIEVSR